MIFCILGHVTKKNVNIATTSVKSINENKIKILNKLNININNTLNNKSVIIFKRSKIIRLIFFILTQKIFCQTLSLSKMYFFLYLIYIC